MPLSRAIVAWTCSQAVFETAEDARSAARRPRAGEAGALSQHRSSHEPPRITAGTRQPRITARNSAVRLRLMGDAVAPSEG